MNIDGLHAILEKDEIVPTRTARDFMDQPQDVDDLYKHHVRTYIPLQAGSDEASGVNDFSKKFIKQVKESRAPRGYITADFGYGKTSAGLFVWQQAQNARLVAVPPFTLNRLEDLLDATAGWVSYVLEKSVPNLVSRANEIYRFYHDRELKSIAERYGVALDQAQRMYEDQALQLSITPKEIVRFFAQMTELVLEAGFDGLIVIPDELQQYLQPEIKSGRIDPLVPLFDLITDLMGRQGKLPFGLLMIITSKELGVINNQRGDLIDRMRGNTLDLRSIYDREFPLRLWQRFAETFEFERIASVLVDEYTLEGLGQIASRQDLSNGPRTVINTFRRIARRAVEAQSTITAYTPIDLIDDFLNSNIAFDARKVLQEATGRALASSIVRGNQDFEQAIKLLAAFPNDGVTRDVQIHYGLQDVCTELKHIGTPEIVIDAGDRQNPALMLRGLDKAVENTDELTLILREFVRNYEPRAANQIQRAVNAFVRLLTTLVFKPEQWSQSRIEYRHFMRNAEAEFEGAFPDMVRKFPERTVYVRILGDDETGIESQTQAECSLFFVLHRHFNVENTKRQEILGHMELDETNYRAQFDLNLMLPCFESLNRLMQDQLRRVVEVEEVNVLMILALNEFLLNAAERNGVSKTLKDMIQSSMSVRLLETALEVLLNAAIDTVFDTAGARIIEKSVAEMIEARYGDQYCTLITYKQWRDSLRDYVTALKQLSSFAQKQGYAAVEGKKDEIAKYFGKTAASFDAFQSRFSDFVQIEEPFSRARGGSIKFTRHPLEEMIFASLEDSTTTTKRNGEVRKALRQDHVYGGASELGYRKDEISFILEIMQARDLVDVDAGWITEKPRPEISLREIRAHIDSFKQISDRLYQASKQRDAEQMRMRADQYLKRFAELERSRNEVELIILAEQVEADQMLLETIVEREIRTLREDISRLELQAVVPDTAGVFSTMIHAGAFTGPINQIRVKYSHVFAQWRSAASAYHENLAQLKRDADDLSIQSLQRVRQRADQLKHKHLDLNDEIRKLNTIVQKIRHWQSVSDILHGLLESIQKLGKPAEQLLQELKAIEAQIVQAFEQDAEKAFESSARYEQQLTQLKTRLGVFSNQAEYEFEQLQSKYRELFIQYAGIHQNRLWQNIFYSATNADGVYENLYQAVERQVTVLIDDLYSRIEQLDGNILALRTMISDGPDIDSELGHMQQSLGDINNSYTHLTDTASADTIRSIDKFGYWLKDFDRVSRNIYELEAQIQRLREQPQTPDLTPQEQALMNALDQSGSSVSLIRVRQNLDGFSDDVFWQAVRSLWERRMISLNLKNFE